LKNSETRTTDHQKIDFEQKLENSNENWNLNWNGSNNKKQQFKSVDKKNIAGLCVPL